MTALARVRPLFQKRTNTLGIGDDRVNRSEAISESCVRHSGR